MNYLYRNRYRCITGLIIWLMLQCTGAMGQVAVSIMIKPPYSSHISDYRRLENKAVITLTNTSSTPRQVRLLGMISNETDGFYIKTGPDYRPSLPIQLGPNATMVLTANPAAMHFLEDGNVITNASSRVQQEIVRTGLLPEGLYRICVDVYDYNSNTQLSAPETGCFTFNISQAQPPSVTYPVNGQHIPQQQSIVNFNWTPPIGNLAGALLQYDLVVVKVMPGQNPNDAVTAARDFNANNPVINKKNLVGQVYVRQPYDLPFEQGSTYAVQVIAHDAHKQLQFLNDGRSEISLFTIDKMEQAPTMSYTQTPAITGTSGSTYVPSNVYVSPSLHGTLKYFFPTESKSNGRALGGKTVRLVLGYQLQSPTGNTEQLAPNNILVGGNFSQDLAVTKTAADGTFFFISPGLDKIDFSYSADPKYFYLSGGGEFVFSVTGKYRRVLLVQVDNDYYCEPDEFFTSVPSGGNLGNIYSKVKTFALTANVQSLIGQSNQSGIMVKLLRSYRPDAVPADEVTPGNTQHDKVTVNGNDYSVLASGYTDGNGEISFGNLVVFDKKNNPWDRYYLSATVDKNNTKYSIFDISAAEVQFRSQASYNKNSIDISDANNVLGTDIISSTYTPASCYNRLTTLPSAPRIYGVVKNTFASVSGSENNQGEGNVKYTLYKFTADTKKLFQKLGKTWATDLCNEGDIGLLSIAVNSVVERQGYTGNDGRYDLSNLDLQSVNGKSVGYFRFLLIEKDGFGKKIIPVKLDKSSGDMGFVDIGQAENMGETDIMPKGGIRIRLVDEQKKNVNGQAYYIDPSINQVGVACKTVSPGVIFLVVPPGSRKIVIRPDNIDAYTEDTVTLNVPEKLAWQESDEINVSVYSKLHRMHLVVTDSKTHQLLEKAHVQLLDIDPSALVNNVTSPYEIFENASDNNNSNGNKSGNNTPGNYSTGNATGGLNAQYGTGSMYQTNNGANPYFFSPADKTTNTKGGVDFALKCAATSYTFLVRSPDGSEYVATTKVVGNTAGKNWQYVTVPLELGRKVTGTVKLGQAPVAGAHVWVDDNSSADIPEIEAYTSSTGDYELHNVPANSILFPLVFNAGKPGYVGSQVATGGPGKSGGSGSNNNNNNTGSNSKKNGMSTGTSMGNLSNSNNGTLSAAQQNTVGVQLPNVVNFTLTTYNDIDLTKLLGFPVEITALKETNSTTKEVQIDGVIDNVPGNEMFSIKTKKSIKFSKLLVVPDVAMNSEGKPFAKPKSLPMVTNINDLDIQVSGYSAGMHDDNGLSLDALNQDGGVLKGKVQVSLASFQVNNFQLQDGQQMFLADNSNNKTSLQLPAFPASGKSVYNSKTTFGIANAQGNPLQYMFYGFKAEADPAGSTLTADQLQLDTKLHTQLKNVKNPDLNIPLGKIYITKKEIKPISNKQSVAMPIDKFTIKSSQLQIGNNGVQIDGTLTAAGMDIPFTGASLQPDAFVIPDNSLKVDKFKLLGVVPVKVNSGASFGYDKSENAWALVVKSAELKGLEGFDANATIPLTSINLYSSGKSLAYLSQSAGAYKLYNIVTFTPSSLLLYDNTFELPGQLQVDMPSFPLYTSSVVYDVKNGKLASPILSDFKMDPLQFNGISLAFNQNKSGGALNLAQDKLTIKGTVSDKDPTVFKDIKYTLTKSSSGTADIVVDQDPKQKLPLGGDGGTVIVSNLAGKMSIQPKSWTNLYLEGDMPASMGFDANNNHMRFDVKGDLEVNSQTVALKNVSTPFGNLSMQYDAPNSRLSGNLQFNNAIAPGSTLSGLVSVCFDKKGYYLVSGATLTMANPNVSGSAAMLMGNYPEKNQEVTTLFQQNSKYYQTFGSMPDGYKKFTDIKGFYFEASASVPVPVIPQFDVNLGLVHAKLNINVGGDARFGMMFASSANTYNIGYSNFINAEFKLGASAIVACAGIDIKALVALDLDGTYQSNGNWNIAATGQFTLSGDTWYGAGLWCDSDCDGLCESSHETASMTIGVQGSLSNSGANYEFYFK